MPRILWEETMRKLTDEEAEKLIIAYIDQYIMAQSAFYESQLRPYLAPMADHLVKGLTSQRISLVSDYDGKSSKAKSKRGL